MAFHAIVKAALTYTLLTFTCLAIADTETIDTHTGKIELQNGYPSLDSVSQLYDEMDFQRAVQAYIWAIPIVSLDALRIANIRDLGIHEGEVGIVNTYTKPTIKALTANSTTIYASSFINLTNGPVIIDSPAGAYGVIDDYWQRPIVEIGPFGPDKGNGGKFLLVPPNYKGKLPSQYIIARSQTNRVMYLARGIVKNNDVKSAVDTLDRIQIYPLSKVSHPAPTRVVHIGEKSMDSIAPRGFQYWQRLADVINNEPVEERDRFLQAMLKPLGIEKDKSFNPDERQKKILTEAAETGFLMAQVISFSPRFANVIAYPGTHWEWVLNLNPNQEAKNYSHLDERANYTFQAITVAEGMIKPIVGAGSQYMSAAMDKNGQWLDGGQTYKLHIPAEVPVKDFWSVTVYDNMTRSMIQTYKNKASLSSYDTLQKNSDGSIDIYFGPSLVKGFESNWIKTTPDKGWFAYFRWYGPTKAFFDKSWRLEDIAPTQAPSES